MRVFHIPRTKTSREGEDVSFAQQNSPSDPEQALLQHLLPPTNNAEVCGPLGPSSASSRPEPINIPFEVVKMKGRWASDAFQLYLQKHAQILAPHMQAVPNLHEEFIHLSIPRSS
ncbi:hypothetical protein BDR07DRAFT_1481570 [Suillus spraguei]|nr:hypothetical protein BDR07DRAFT_1481570 [Suillus spraguei]